MAKKKSRKKKAVKRKGSNLREALNIVIEKKKTAKNADLIRLNDIESRLQTAIGLKQVVHRAKVEE